MKGVVEQYWREIADPDDEIFDWEGLRGVLTGMDIMDVFQLGYRSDVREFDEYYTFDGYGNVKSMSNHERLQEMRSVAESEDLAKAIARGGIDIPEDMAAILRIFLDAEGGKRLSSWNVKAKTKRKATPKKPAARLKTAPRRTAQVKKTAAKKSPAGSKAKARPKTAVRPTTKARAVPAARKTAKPVLRAKTPASGRATAVRRRA